MCGSSHADDALLGVLRERGRECVSSDTHIACVWKINPSSHADDALLGVLGVLPLLEKLPRSLSLEFSIPLNLMNTELEMLDCLCMEINPSSHADDALLGVLRLHSDRAPTCRCAPHMQMTHSLEFSNYTRIEHQHADALLTCR